MTRLPAQPRLWRRLRPLLAPLLARLLSPILPPLVALLLAGNSHAQGFDYQLVPERLAAGVHVFIGQREDFNTRNGGNIVNTACLIGRDGLIVIDSGPSRRYGEQLRAACARLSPLPVRLVLNSHFHPDHFLGNQAFADSPIAALAATRDGIARQGNAFAENLYRLSGDWMSGTEVHAPDRSLSAGELEVAGRRLQLYALHGHTDADLAIYDRDSGVLFAGDLVFHERAPTTPHAAPAAWLAALAQLEALTRQPGFTALVPGHGPVARDAGPIRQTRAWLNWLQTRLAEAARAGLDMNEVLALPLPAEFARLPLAREEYRRSVSHLFPAAERALLEGGR